MRLGSYLLLPTTPRELPGDVISAVLGRTFLVPDAVGDLDQLRRAVAVGRDPKYRERRRALYNWQRQFLSETGTTDRRSVESAVEEMRLLVADLETATHEQTAWTHLKRVFFFAQIAASVASAIAMPPLAISTAVIAIGQYLTTDRLAKPTTAGQEVPSAALLVEARRDLDVPGPYLRGDDAS